MGKTFISGTILAATLGAALSLAAPAEIRAEGPGAPPPSQPAGPPKRMPWGDPDITGVWLFVFDGKANPAGAVDLVHGPPKGSVDATAAAAQLPAELTKWPGSLVHGTPDGDVPYAPWAKARRQERLAKLDNPPSEDFLATQGRCLLNAMPGAMLRFNPHVYQFPDHILMEWEYPQMHRIIWMDGRSPPPPQVKLWQGFSVGHWEGETLVVTTTNQNGFSWLDQTGDVMSESTKTTEYIKMGPTIAYKVVVEDPNAYTQPWWMEWSFNVIKPGAMPAMPPGAPPPGAKPPPGAPPLPPGAALPPGVKPPPGAPGAAAAQPGAALPPGVKPPPGAPGAAAAAQPGAAGLPTDINAFMAMMAMGEMLEVACVEGERHHSLERFHSAQGKAK